MLERDSPSSSQRRLSNWLKKAHRATEHPKCIPRSLCRKRSATHTATHNESERVALAQGGRGASHVLPVSSFLFGDHTQQASLKCQKAMDWPKREKRVASLLKKGPTSLHFLNRSLAKISWWQRLEVKLLGILWCLGARPAPSPRYALMQERCDVLVQSLL